SAINLRVIVPAPSKRSARHVPAMIASAEVLRSPTARALGLGSGHPRFAPPTPSCAHLHAHVMGEVLLRTDLSTTGSTAIQRRTTMGSWLTEREQRLGAGAEEISAPTPIPTQIVSNGESLPPPQSETQKRVERRMLELADVSSKRLGLSRRQFMQTSCGMAAAFLAMNEIYGN